MFAKYTVLGCYIVALSKTLVLLLVIVWGHLVGAQSNGDIRIVQNPNNTFIEYWDPGRLEVYLDGEWGTICANGFNAYAADVACRQLGYEDSSGKISKAIDYADVIPLASNSTPIHAGLSECGKTNDGGFSHILRCFYLYADPTCTHDDDVIIQCSIFHLVNSGYDTELFLDSKALNSTYKSSGVLQIFSSSQSGAFWGWSNICGSRFDQNAANTACIQLGYTGALSYTTHANRSREVASTDIWLDGVTCGDNVYTCLDSCFCYPRTLTAVQCDPGNVVALTCTFDLAKRDRCGLYILEEEICVKKLRKPIALQKRLAPKPQQSSSSLARCCQLL